MNKKIIYTDSFGNEHPCTFELNSYRENRNFAVLMYTYIGGFKEPYATLTVNFSEKLEKYHAYIDVNNLDNITVWLEENGLATYTGRQRISGFCIYPEYEFDIKAIKQYVETDHYHKE
jgi:hypothetical protein